MCLNAALLLITWFIKINVFGVLQKEHILMTKGLVLSILDNALVYLSLKSIGKDIGESL